MIDTYFTERTHAASTCNQGTSTEQDYSTSPQTLASELEKELEGDPIRWASARCAI